MALALSPSLCVELVESTANGGVMNLDLLAIAAHPDDVELTCGGTLLKMAQRGYKTGILDLTAGEMGTRGTPEIRAKEAAHAARLLAVAWRGTLGVPDSDVQPSRQHTLRLAAVIRQLRPRKSRTKSSVHLAIDRLEGEMNQLARHYGQMIGVDYGEPFLQKELMKVADIVKMEVRSI